MNNAEIAPPRFVCWLCGGSIVHKQGDGFAREQLTSKHFAITDSDYGTTLSIYHCESCGYKFCPESGDVTHYYAELEDKEYERTRQQRSVQAQYLLEKIQQYKSVGTLLDIGAGSGILVEQAQLLGFEAHGIEPSKWLVEQAQSRNIAVTIGAFPDAALDGRYDVITLVDVLEHVHCPLELLQGITKHLNAGGIAAIVTPDVQSIAARIMGKRWWHYRIAHLSYFDKKTLMLALQKSGLEPITWHRPTWYFPLDYLLSRLGRYLPFIKNLSSLRCAKTINIPLNLYDSWLVFVRRSS